MKYFFLIAGLFLAPAAAFSHPMDQYRMEMQLSSENVQIKVMTSLSRTDKPSGPQGESTDGTQAQLAPAFPHFNMTCDGRPVEWTEQPPRELSDSYGTWLEYDAKATFTGKPTQLAMALDSNDKASFVLVVHYPDGKTITDLLTSRHTLELTPASTPFPAAKNSQKTTAETPVSEKETPAANDSSTIFGAYVEHGIWHILTGYDHMLFMAALVLAATSLWDLVKVVTAFTLAHTVTLTLSVLDIYRLNERIVEPMIAASIVFVALQNIFYPRSSRGWTRLAIAFGFGLFHGLGFAGGLLDAMSGLSGVTVATAIIAFSIGVELGHQVVVVPLYTARCLIRRGDKTGRESISRRVTVIGSALISMAGLYFLIMALFP